MSKLKQKLAAQIPGLREQTKQLLAQHAKTVVSEVTVDQLYGGMRGVKALICDTSLVEPDAGLLIRGKPILELAGRLPEEIFWLLLTGALPSSDELADLKQDLARRREVPAYVWDVLKAMPPDSHAMCMLNTAILVQQRESEFRRRYDAGMKKDEHWEATLEDALNLVARTPVVAAGVYRHKFGKGPRIPPDPKLDMGADFARMLGLPDPKGEFADLIRLYLTLHSDHENGNVSAMATSVVGSALSDLYYSVAAGMNGLAGPLHGLANQECLAWILETNKKFGGSPTHEQLKTYAWETLNGGRVVPGYGHAVLRITDPRYTAFLEFGKKHCPTDPVFQTVARVFEVVPDVLKQVQKIKDPWPNVDAISGSLLYHYGLREFPFYTDLFAVSRTMGVCAQAVVARAMSSPIFRPKSVTTGWVQKTVAGK